MDNLPWFATPFRPPKLVELSSDVIETLPFPGGFTISATEGKHLSNELSWKDLRVDIFISAEEALESLVNIASSIRESLRVASLISHSNGKCRRVIINEGHNHGKEQREQLQIHTFVPVTVIMGLLLINLHKFDVPKKLRFATLAFQSLEKALEQYPKIARENKNIKDSQASRFSELGITNDEFEACQQAKYEDSYRMMRRLIPPNIARTTLQKMLSDGVPKGVADRVWNKKVLWLLCMHSADIPKVHIADLRAKYDCHGLDIVELRALWHILPKWEGGSPKAEWRRALKTRLDELVAKEISGNISENEIRDIVYLGYDNLVVYVPERELFRQFGVSSTAVGLRPGQRREKVFSEKMGAPPSSSSGARIGNATISLPHRNTENISDSDLESESFSDSDSASLSNESETDENAVGSDEQKSQKSLDEEGYEQKNSFLGEGGDLIRYRLKGKLAKDRSRGIKEQSRARIKYLSPISGMLLDDEESDEEEVRDTELDDLLNNEIDMSGLDIDKEGYDRDLDGDEDTEVVTNHWQETRKNGYVGSSSSTRKNPDSGQISGKEISGSPKMKVGRDRSLTGFARISESCNIPKPRIRTSRSATLIFNEKEQKALSVPMVIETLRPFGASSNSLLKKPLKRLNFVANSGKTPESRRWQSESRNSDSPDIFSDFDSSEKVPVQQGGFNETPSAQSSIFPSLLDSAYSLKRKSLQRLEGASPLEEIYSKNSTSSTRYEFNPLVFPSTSPKEKRRLSIEMIDRGNDRLALAPEFDVDNLNSNSNTSPVVKAMRNLDDFQSIASPYPSTGKSSSFSVNPLSASKGPLDSFSEANSRTPVQSDTQLTSPSQILMLAQEGALHVMDYFSPLPRRRVTRRVVTGRFANKTEEFLTKCDVINGNDDDIEHGNSSLLRRAAADDSLLGFTMRSVESKRGSARKQALSPGEDHLSDCSTNSSMNVTMKSVLSPIGGLNSKLANAAKSEEGRDNFEDQNQHEQYLIDERVAKQFEKDKKKKGTKESKKSGHQRATLLADPGQHDVSDHNLSKAEIDNFQEQGIFSDSYCDYLLESSDSEENIQDDTKASNSVFDIFTDLMTSRKGDRRLSSTEELEEKQMEAEIDNFILPKELSPIILKKYGINIGVREVNGIRMNALKSLPALLSAIGKGSKAQPEGGMEELSSNELGVWEDVSQSGDLSLSHIAYSEPEDVVEVTNVAMEKRVSETSTSQKKKKDGGFNFDGLYINLLDVDDDINILDDAVNEVKVSDSIERLINMAAPTSESGVFRDRSLFDHGDDDDDDDDFISIPSPLSASSIDTFPLFDNQYRKVEVGICDGNSGEGEGETQQVATEVETQSEQIDKTLSDRDSRMVIDDGRSSAMVFEIASDDNRKFLCKETGNKSNSMERHSNMVVSIPASSMTPNFRDLDRLDADPETEIQWPLMSESLLAVLPSTAHPVPEIPQELIPNPLIPNTPLTSEEAEDLILFGEAYLAWQALAAGTLVVSESMATSLLQRCAVDPESITEPMETLVLLVDKLGADVNAKDENSMTPLHSLFSRPNLGRFILSRGGDILAKDDNGDCVLAMCAEYGYDWIVPAFMSMQTREANLLDDPLRAHEYVVILISSYGYGKRAKEIIDDGLVEISADEALEIMDTSKGKYENMKEPIETFELLQQLILS